MLRSIQETINDDGNIDYELLDDYIRSKNFVLANNIDELKAGYQFKYIRLKEDGTHKFINSWICLQNNENYILYRWWNGSVWSLQKNEIVKLWYKKYESKNDKDQKYPDGAIVFRKPIDEHKFDIYIGDTLVHKAKSEYHRQRFMKTNKYERALRSMKFYVDDE